MLQSKVKIEGFTTLKSYTSSKGFASNKLKRKSVNDITSMLCQTHESRLKRYFGRFRAIVKDKHIKSSTAKKIILKIENGNLRWAFESWRKNTEKVVFAQELNETGPITEQVFEARRTIRNLKGFMRSENYTQEEVTAKVKECEDWNEHAMSKLVKRLKVPRKDRQVSRCFDHWVMWLKVKRLMRHQLNFCNAQVTPV